MNAFLIGAVAILVGAPTISVGRGGEPAAPARSGQWSWHGAVAAGKTLEIRGINGAIEAEPTSGGEVVVTAIKQGYRSDPATVRIEVVRSGGDVVICAVYPGGPNHCGAGDDYHMNTSNNDVSVRFHAQVPAGVAFTATDVNGAVEADGLAGPVDAATVNGSVHVQTSVGDAAAHTTNGSITAVVHGSGTGALSFGTTNGGITVSLPRGLDADLDASTVNGSIETDFPVTVSGHLDKHQLKGRIGRGGRALHVETTNGSIRLRAL
jgi:Toastrack DUF4097